MAGLSAMMGAGIAAAIDVGTRRAQLSAPRSFQAATITACSQPVTVLNSAYP